MCEFQKVSIVIPAYNSAKYIARTLESVYQIDYPTNCLELIVVDDGSTDSTAEIVKNYFNKFKFQCALIQQKNHGASYARNVGWKLANNQWIQFLDADDVIHKSKIKIQLHNIENINSKCAVLYSVWQKEMDDALINVIKPNLRGDIVLKLIMTSNFTPFGACLVNRSCLELTSGFNEYFSMIEDVDLMLRMAINGVEFINISSDVPLFMYMNNDRSLTNQSGNLKLFYDGCVRNAKLVQNYWINNDIDIDQLRRSTLMEIYVNALYYYAGYDYKRFSELYAFSHKLQKPICLTSAAVNNLSKITGLFVSYILVAKIHRIYDFIKSYFS